MVYFITLVSQANELFFSLLKLIDMLIGVNGYFDATSVDHYL